MNFFKKSKKPLSYKTKGIAKPSLRQRMKIMPTLSQKWKKKNIQNIFFLITIIKAKGLARTQPWVAHL